MDKSIVKNLVAAIVTDLVHAGLIPTYPEAIPVAFASLGKHWDMFVPCPRCNGKGWRPLPPDPARPNMARCGPCTCTAGQKWAQGIADFVNENPPDKIIES